ncbi:MAG TPA: hypothetical protein VI357_11880 [Mycobacteriales bacterium]
MPPEPRADRVELRCHLDGSVRPGTIADLAAEAGIRLAAPVRSLAVAPPDVGSLHAFLPYLDVTLGVLQTPAALQRAARELVEDWHADGVGHGEVRFAPQLHGRLGLSVGRRRRAAPRVRLDQRTGGAVPPERRGRRVPGPRAGPAGGPVRTPLTVRPPASCAQPSPLLTRRAAAIRSAQARTAGQSR